MKNEDVDVDDDEDDDELAEKPNQKVVPSDVLGNTSIKRSGKETSF